MSEEGTTIKQEGLPLYIEDKVIEYFRVKTLLRERLFFKKKMPFDNQASDFFIIIHEVFLLVKNNMNNGLKTDVKNWFNKEVPENEEKKRLHFKKGLEISEKLDVELDKLGITSLNTFGGYIPI
ncbi:hypothetical protein KAW18_01540 [candidate division WOR-3 bacterium]|nr:hypothetical protein [candidate division WOR-3 bacterium]